MINDSGPICRPSLRCLGFEEFYGHERSGIQRPHLVVSKVPRQQMVQRPTAGWRILHPSDLPIARLLQSRSIIADKLTSWEIWWIYRPLYLSNLPPVHVGCWEQPCIKTAIINSAVLAPCKVLYFEFRPGSRPTTPHLGRWTQFANYIWLLVWSIYFSIQLGMS